MMCLTVDLMMMMMINEELMGFVMILDGLG